MKAYQCFPVNLNRDPRWQLRVVEDGGEFEPVPGHPFYESETACQIARDRLDREANGDATP